MDIQVFLLSVHHPVRPAGLIWNSIFNQESFGKLVHPLVRTLDILESMDNLSPGSGVFRWWDIWGFHGEGAEEEGRATKKFICGNKNIKARSLQSGHLPVFFRRIITPLKKGVIRSIYKDWLGAHFVTNFKNLQESFNTDITSWLVNLNHAEIRV